MYTLACCDLSSQHLFLRNPILARHVVWADWGSQWKHSPSRHMFSPSFLTLTESAHSLENAKMLQSDIKTVHIYLQHPNRKTNAHFKVAQIIFLDDDSNLFLNSDGFFFFLFAEELFTFSSLLSPLAVLSLSCGQVKLHIFWCFQIDC